MEYAPSFLRKVAQLSLLLLSSTGSGALFAADQVSPDAINFRQINEYAQFANAAYQSEGEIRQLGAQYHYTLSRYGTIPELEVAYCLLTDGKSRSHVIAVRGTTNVENALVDANLQLKIDPRTGIRLHSGFSQAAQRIYHDLKPLLQTDYSISATGHSLGGAVALILAFYLDADHFPINQVVTFGQPKVTNVAGAEKLGHLPVLRVVTARDLVPLVPLFDPMDIKNLDVYWHAGKEVILLPGTRYSMLEGLNSMLRATKFTQEPLTKDNLQNHQMALYLDMVQAKLTSATQVPFETSLNLFNLFGSGEQTTPDAATKTSPSP